jgi:hypothetical protein
MVDETPSPVYIDEPDLILHALIALVSQVGGESAISMTLNVHGSMMTGLLVPRDRWLEEFERQAAGIGKAGADLGAGLRAAIHQVELEAPGTGGDEPPPYRIHRWVHLINARPWPRSDFPPDDEGFVWRGRLSDVSGWALGTPD